MTIVSLDGQLSGELFQQIPSTVLLSHNSKRSIISLSPHTFSEKWKIPKTGFYTPTDVSIVITPHISETAGVMACLRLVDTSDLSPTRILYQSKKFNLGTGLTVEGSQLPFCLPVGEYPIQFEVTVSQSQFQDTRTMYSTSLEWRMMLSPTPLSRVKSVFVEAIQPPCQVGPYYHKIKNNKSRGGKGRVTGGPLEQTVYSGGGTTPGLVTGDCVGPLQTFPVRDLQDVV
nr:MAG: putative movement protein [Tombusviridae sp.]